MMSKLLVSSWSNNNTLTRQVNVRCSYAMASTIPLESTRVMLLMVMIKTGSLPLNNLEKNTLSTMMLGICVVH